MRKCLLTILLLCSTVLYSQGTVRDVLDNTVTPCTVTYGTVVNVSTVQELKNAINLANSSGGNMTVLIADGTYQIATESWYPYITGSNIVFRSESGRRDDVILTGSGMEYGSGTENIFYLAGNNIVIADLTLREAGNHGIATHTDSHLFYNLRIQDTYEQMVKGTASGDGADNCTVECCLFEYTSGIGPQYYIGGIDVHMGDGWTIKDNVFMHIKSPSGSAAEHAVHFWNNSSGNTVERNLIMDCDRGIGFGLGTSPNTGGIIKNNMIFNDGTGIFNDVGIGLESSPGTRVYNNTIFIQYMNSIEYRFSSTVNVDIKNNLVNRPVTSRDGATGTVESNHTDAQLSWFNDPVSGDLSLFSDISGVVDSGIDLSGYVEDDIYKTIRPIGTAWDIGAHEYIPAPADSAAISMENLALEGIWHWIYDPLGGQWSRLLAGVACNGMEAGDITGDGNIELVANITGQGLWMYSFLSSSWTFLGNEAINFALCRASLKMPLQVSASFESQGLYILNYNTMTWSRIINIPAIILESGNIDDTQTDELLLSFSGIEGIYTYSFADQKFSLIIAVSPDQVISGDISEDGMDEIISAFEGFGIYSIKKAQGTGWDITRLTWGTPDPGHFMSAGNISGSGASELVFTYLGRTYVYSQDTRGWSVLVNAPLKRIISGKFTGNVLDDLIVCESITNNIILYKASESLYETLAFGGDAGSMTSVGN